MAPTFLQKITGRNRAASTSVDISINIQDNDSSDSLNTVSTQPNVTVIPPSPLVRSNDLDDDDESSVSEDHHQSPVSPAATVTPTNNFSFSAANMPSATAIRKQPSNKSLKNKPPLPTLPPPLPISSHQRSATAPPTTVFPDASTESDSIVLLNSVSESPTSQDTPINKSDSPVPLTLSSSPKNIGVLMQSEKAGSVMSLASTAADGKGTKRPWKRSTTRKPTGLASALAASGLAMANTTLSPSHSAQAAAQLSPPVSNSNSSGQKGSTPGSPPYMSKSASQSMVSQRSSQGKKIKTNNPPNSSPRQARTRRVSRATSAKSDAGGVSEHSTGGLLNGTKPPGSRAASVNGDEALLRSNNNNEFYYSALELDADTSSSSSERDERDDEDDAAGLSGSDGGFDEEVEYVDDLIPVTGFAVASTKRNHDFHELFPTVPEGDYLIEDYGCALQREILIQGRLYISENHICFHANIFGWITDLSVPVYEITALEKRMTAFVIPNAIQITTRQAKYTFTSFLSRDTTFDVMYNIWRLSRPAEDTMSIVSGSGRGSLEGGAPPLSATASAAIANSKIPVATAKTTTPVHKATVCVCSKEGRHYSETAMAIVIPGTPEKIHNMMFASGFIKEFLSENQRLLDIQMSDWAPVSPGSNLLIQNMTYIKPLAGSLGPKQTKCEIKHEMEFCDFDQYVTTVTTTRTPDVPSGGVFAVKTRTCVMWASPVSSKVVVTSQVEWSGRSFIKGIIEKSAIDGQKAYVSDLEKAMRSYIQAHQSEFLPEGVEATAIPDAEQAAASGAGGAAGAATGTAGLDGKDKIDHHQPTAEELKQRERERNARGLQWAWDTFDGAYQVAKRSTKGALELIKDAWDQSTSTTILWFVIVILVMSNVWTLMRMGTNKAMAARNLEARKVEEREKWVQSIVTALWEELAVAGAAGSQGGVGGVVIPPHGSTIATTPTIQTTTILDSILVMSTSLSPSHQQSTTVSTHSPSPMRNNNIDILKEEIRQIRLTLQELESKVLVIKDDLVKYEIDLDAAAASSSLD